MIVVGSWAGARSGTGIAYVVGEEEAADMPGKETLMDYSYILLWIELCTVAIVMGIGLWSVRSPSRRSGTYDDAGRPNLGRRHVRKHDRRMSVN
jgi:hypothetical protein